MKRKNENTFYLGDESLPTKNTKIIAPADELIKYAGEMEKCRKNLLYFAENYFFIKEPDKGRIKIPLYPFQRRFLRKIRDNRFTIFNTSRQVGKALDLNTPILTPNGWTTQGQLKLGDQVYDENGKICNVTFLHPIEYNRPCYKVIFDNGEEIIADAEHEWFTQDKNERKRNIVGSIKTTKELVKHLTTGAKKEPFHRIPKCPGIEGLKTDLEIDPYLLGYWLGDGTTAEASFTVGEQFINEFEHNLQLLGENYSYNKHIMRINTNSGLKTYKIKCESSCEFSLLHKLKKYNLIGNKHIPAQYFLASRQQRLELLSGLIDSDGWVSKKGFVQFYTTNEIIKNNVIELLRGLGYKPSIKFKSSRYNDKICKSHYRISFIPNDIICKLSFKRNRIRPASDIHRSQYHYIKDIIPVESVPVRCITVDSPNHMYLAGKQLIPTHNSTIMTIFALWYVLNNADKNVLLVANKEDTAIEIFDRIKMAYKELPNWLKPGVEKWDGTKLILSNGSRISVSTTTTSAARGMTINVLLLDEFAFVEKAEEFFKSVYPTISASKTSKIVITSTPNGDNNIFYKLCKGAEQGTNGWAYDSVVWSDIPGRDEKWREQTMATVGGLDAFAQEFEAIFISSRNSFVNEEIIQNLKYKVSPPIYEFEDGAYKIWEDPDPERIYVAGVDSAEGIGQDNSVINIMDITYPQDIKQVATYVNNKVQLYDFAKKCNTILKQWGSPLALIERNNQGATVVDNLINQYYYENIVSYGAKYRSNTYTQQGIVSTGTIRSKAVNHMRYLLTDAQTVTINDPQLLDEFKSFVRRANGTWAAPNDGKSHDDRVMALVWSLFILHNDLNEHYFRLQGFDKNGAVSRIAKKEEIQYFTESDNVISVENRRKNDCFLMGSSNNNTLDINWDWLANS